MATFAGHTYENGYVPRAILAPLDGENYGDAELRRDAAESWNRARADVEARTGIVLTVRGWNRTLAEQEQFFFERYRPQATGDGPYDDVRWYKQIRYVRYGTAAAAIPGRSNHGWGLAVDVVDYGGVGNFSDPRRVKSIDILKRHGWTDDEGRGSIQEPWHLVYVPARDTHPTILQEEPDMDTTQAKELNETRHIVGELLALLTTVIKDGSGAAPPRAILERTLDVSRRTLAAVIADEAAPAPADVAAEDVADALLAKLTPAVAQGVADALAARLAQ